MTDTSDHPTSHQIVEDLTRQNAAPLDIGDDLYLTVSRDGITRITNAADEREQLQPRPRRTQAQRTVHDPETFAAYLAKYQQPETEVWANVITGNIIGVIDAGADHDTPGWREHTVVYSIEPTPAWESWTAKDGKWTSQEAMAEHFEDRLPDFVEPEGAAMLELAQTFQASRSGTFESSQRISTGETALVYRQDVSATGGKQRMAIPDQFTLALVPFEGAPPYKVTVRFRYRIREERLTLSYKIDRPEEIVRAAFDDVVAAVDELVPQQILHGAP